MIKIIKMLLFIIIIISVMTRSSSLQLRSIRMSYESTWSNSKIIASFVKQVSFPYICSKEGLRGLGAVKGFEKNNVIIEVPIDKCLAAPEESNQDKCPDPELLTIWKSIKGSSKLSLLLLKEYELKQSSVIYDYIQNLPEPGKIGTPFHWNVEELDKIPYPYLVRSVAQQKELWKKFYSMLPKSYSNFPYDRFIWAMEIVRSRAFNGIGGLGKSNANIFGGLAGSLLGAAIISSQTVGETVPAVLGGLAVISLIPAVLEARKSSCVLLPVIDSCNHNSIDQNSELALEPSKNSFVIRAKENIKNGEQISISYGERTNDDLLQYFGFVEIDNPNDSYFVLDPIGALKNALNNNESNNVLSSTKKIEILKAIKELEKTKSPSAAFDDVMVVTKKNFLSWSLGSLVYIQEELLDFNDNGNNKNDDNMIISAMNSVTMKNCLKLILSEELNSINTYITSNNIDGEISCIIQTFLREKIKVIEKSMESL